MNYNVLSQTAHAAAKANGWYDKVQPINTYLMLVKSELYEALDAFRGNKYALTKHWAKEINLSESDYQAFAADFKLEIKDTFQDEIADTAIRILDFCGWYGIELGEAKKIQTKPKGQFDSDLVSMDKLITSTYDIVEKDVLSISLTVLLGMLESIAQVYDFDLEQHIALKMAYNKTRGYKHGNKVL